MKMLKAADSPRWRSCVHYQLCKPHNHILESENSVIVFLSCVKTPSCSLLISGFITTFRLISLKTLFLLWADFSQKTIIPCFSRLELAAIFFLPVSMCSGLTYNLGPSTESKKYKRKLVLSERCGEDDLGDLLECTKPPSLPLRQVSVQLRPTTLYVAY